MRLEEYRKKRDFRHTPEPRGGKRGNTDELHFVIQKHAARRLHYDFRLELDGALKSWAVPNEPSTDPSIKRLAVHVEDHPLDYAKFEGVIPEGHYGAGKVEIWDEGVWRPQGDARAGYRKGHLAFELEGKRLHGGWDLVRMRPKAGEKNRDNWLLIKSKKKPEKSKTKPASMPRIMSPQLATLVETAPEGDDWFYEIKYDGYRMLVRIDDGKVRIYSRNGKDWTSRFPKHAHSFAKLPVRQAWLDGEMAVFMPDGNTSFQALQNAMDEGAEANVLYAVFDLLYLDGEDWSARPLIERKDRLRELLAKKTPPLVFYSEHQAAEGKDAWAHACEHELEGIIGKRADAAYVQNRSKSWIKLKCRRGQELVIGGYTEPSGSRSGFGALLMGVREGKELRYAGKVGTGFDDRTLATLRKRLARLEQKKSPFADGTGAPKGSHWVKPELVADIKFHGWTEDGLLRQGAFMGLREDKPTGKVTKEEPQEKENIVAGVAISHPERVLYSAAHVTKLDLARYYESVAEWILPQLLDRPLSLVRCPRGPAQKCFFQRNAHETMPKRGRFIVADTLPALEQLVQMGVIELHTWGSRAKKPLSPDRMIFDLDPDPDLPWASVVNGATLVRTLLNELRLESYVKTTGGKGLHVVVPLRPGHSWKEVKDFSRRVAEHLAATLPEQFTARISKTLRRKKIFVDYLRNQEGATAVAAYSVRAREAATVSVPLAWSELDAGLKPGRFDLKGTLSRLKQLKADPWEGYAERQRLTRVMQNML